MKNLINKVLFMFMSMLLTLTAFAQDAAQKSGLDKVLDAITAGAGSATAWMSAQSNGMIMLIIGGALDLILRYSKTEKPLDLLRLMVAGLNKIGTYVPKIAGAVMKIGEVLEAAAQFLDKILGQRTAPPAP